MRLKLERWQVECATSAGYHQGDVSPIAHRPVQPYLLMRREGAI
ncbi:hypothetical protein PN498_01415 [Oscillatoria sp. CS-180]|nr:hypothetical protein [Oscillatoria sp. CS-180]MDB9524632.1 hypothetical protein [Oscillatoria sp. CS-180]